jgi:exodeoxyribonuclease V gamma subunit
VIFDEGPQALPDEEAFSIAGLERYGLIESLCDALRRHLLTLPVGVMAQHELDPLFTRLLNRMSSSASLPLGGPGWQAREHVKALVLPMIEAWRAVRDAHPVGLQRLSLRHEHAGLVVEDWLDQRIASDGLAAQGVWLSITASELLRDHKKPTPRPEKLMGVWVRSLLAASAHCSDCSMIVGRDALLKVHPMAESMAREGLAQLLDAWLEGQQQPLPVAPRAALAFITNYDENEAIRAYEGGDYLIAEVDEPCLARCFPDFDSLTADGRFVRLAQQLYQPLAQWAQQHVEVLALPGASDPAVEE